MIDWEFRLAEASGDGNSNTVQKLLKRYVDPNSRDRLGASAISKAAKGILIVLESSSKKLRFHTRSIA